MSTIVMDHDQKFCELTENVISLHTNYVKREIRERQFSLSIVIYGEKHVNFIVISHKIAEIT